MNSIANYIDGQGLGRVAHAGSANLFGQTFLAMQSGPLHSIELIMRRNGATPPTLLVEFWPVDELGVPVGVTSSPFGVPMASSSQCLSMSSTYEPYRFDFSDSGVFLTAGTMYAWTLRSSAGDGGYDLRGRTVPGSYTGGQAFQFFQNQFRLQPYTVFSVADWLFEVRVGSRIPGDVDSDGVVGVQDLASFLPRHGSRVCAAMYRMTCDLDGMPDIGSGDLAVLLSRLGSACSE